MDRLIEAKEGLKWSKAGIYLMVMYVYTPPPAYISDLPPYIVPAAVALACAIAYQVASYPNGYMFVAMKLVNAGIMKTGPRNLEAEDMLKAGKPWIAFFTFMLDVIKGPFAIIAGIAFGALFLKSYIAPDPHEHVCIPELSLYMLFLPPIAALLGHVFPLWLKFKGGKGFANALGIYFFLNPTAGMVTAAVWLAVFLATRYSSLAAIVSMALSPLWGWIFATGVWLELPDVSPHFAFMTIVLAFIVLYRHKDNIRCLRNGTEPKWKRAVSSGRPPAEA